MKMITDQHSKHFARISPYLISDMLNLLVSHSIESSIKVSNATYLILLIQIIYWRGQSPEVFNNINLISQFWVRGRSIKNLKNIIA